MRLNSFESMGIEPLGEGQEKRTFINPEDEKRVISEKKEDAEKDTPCQLKGRYYLTKIAHSLLPDNIPDIYQAGESVKGKQTVDVERISHTSEHSLLQKKRLLGEDEESVKEQIIDDMGKKMGELDLELERIGLSFNIDENVGNYTKDEEGNVHYLETFKPWQVNPTNPKELEILFDEEELREAIGSISNQVIKERSTKYLDRLLVLLEEDKQELQAKQEYLKANLIESGPHIEELEVMFVPFMKEEFLLNLNVIQTEEEARNSEERSSANEALVHIFKKLQFLLEETNITDEKYNELQEKRQTLSMATGTINRGIVDHSR